MGLLDSTLHITYLTYLKHVISYILRFHFFLFSRDTKPIQYLHFTIFFNNIFAVNNKLKKLKIMMIKEDHEIRE